MTKRPSSVPPPVRRQIVDALKVLLGEDLSGLGEREMQGPLELRVVVPIDVTTRLQSRSLATTHEIRTAITEVMDGWRARMAEIRGVDASQLPVMTQSTEVAVDIDDDDD